jgi:phosphate-selective porin OprO and OprP
LGVTGVVLLWCAAADGQTGGDADMRAELEALRAVVGAQQQQLDQQAAELSKMRQQQQASWLDQSRQAEVDEIAERVLSAAAEADAGRPLAGWDNGFFLAAADNSFRLQLLGQIQFRHVFAAQDSTADASGDDVNNGFEVSRFRLGLRGHVIDPSWQFYYWGGHGAGGDYLPLDVWIRKQINDHWWIQAGQFKAPLWKEWMFAETTQAFVERSLLNFEFWGFYTEGVNIGYQSGPLAAVLSINDGLNAAGAPAGVVGGGHTSPWNEPGVVGAAVTGRVDYLLAGDWGRGNDFQAWTGSGADSQLLAIVGGGAHYQHGDWHSSGADEGQVVRWTADVLTKYRGVGLFGAVIGNHVSNLDLGPDLNQYGVLAQAGWFVSEDLELLARYEWGRSDVAGESDLSIITVGFNRFFAGHRLKWSTDVGFGLNPVSATWAAPGAGWRADSPGKSGQVVARSQLQLLF